VQRVPFLHGAHHAHFDAGAVALKRAICGQVSLSPTPQQHVPKPNPDPNPNRDPNPTTMPIRPPH